MTALFYFLANHMLISGALLFVAVFICETTIGESTWWPFTIDYDAKNLAWWLWHLQWFFLAVLAYFLPGTCGVFGITFIVLFSVYALFAETFLNTLKETS